MTVNKADNISSIPIDGFSNLRITSLWTFFMSVSSILFPRFQWRLANYASAITANRSLFQFNSSLAAPLTVVYVCLCLGMQVQWSEPWLIGLLVFHAVCLFLTLLTCKYYRAQICHFLLVGTCHKTNYTVQKEEGNLIITLKVCTGIRSVIY